MWPFQKKKSVRIETSPAFPHEAVDITSLETVKKDNKTFVVDFNDNGKVVLQPYKSGGVMLMDGEQTVKLDSFLFANMLLPLYDKNENVLVSSEEPICFDDLATASK